MYSKNAIRSADDFAKDYEEYVSHREWFGTEMLFGLMFEYIKKGQTLLDIGIGTGLSARLFVKAGLEVTGVDGSSEMLKICSHKGIAKVLKQYNLVCEHMDFDKKFDLIISYALFHLIGDLSKIFENIREIITDHGTFGFSVMKYDSVAHKEYISSGIKGIYKYENEQTGITTFRHSDHYISELLNKTGFKVIKKTEILAFKDSAVNQEIFFELYVVRF